MTEKELLEVNKRRLNKICDLCGGRSNVFNRFEGHHLQYEPEEIVISLCVKCHDVLHALAKLLPSQRKVALDLVEKFSHQWSDRSEKYFDTMWWRVVSKCNTKRNAPKIQARRRFRYKNDPEYKQKSLDQNKEYWTTKKKLTKK